MDIALLVFVVAAGGVGWFVMHRAQKRASVDRSAAPRDFSDYLTPKPLAPDFEVRNWDGYTGMQVALCIELSDNVFFPLIEAGTVPPVATTRTFSTGNADQRSLIVTLYAGFPGNPRRMELFRRISIGPIPLTGEAIREIEATFSVDEQGEVHVTATYSRDSSPLEWVVLESGLGAIPIGR